MVYRMMIEGMNVAFLGKLDRKSYRCGGQALSRTSTSRSYRWAAGEDGREACG